MANTFVFSNNAQSTLATSISNVALTASLAPGSGALFPALSAGEQFPLTFTDAATGLLNEIVYVTAISGDNITMIRGQEGTTPLAWAAGDIAALLVTAGALESFAQTINNRTRLQANMTVYVATTGNDSTGDGSSGSPWLTVQHAVTVTQSLLDLNGFSLTIMRAAGAYTDATSVFGQYVGQIGPESLILDGAGMGSVTVTAPICYQATYGGSFTLQNQKLIASGGVSRNIVSGTGGDIQFQAVDFGAGVNQINATSAGNIQCIGNYQISGNATTHISTSGGGTFFANNMTCTLVGNPVFSDSFANSGQVGIISSTGMNWSGAATGARYNANLNGVIVTSGGGPNYFPGSTAGSTTTGGQYS